ncbi:MAG: prepilin-type N-terminal cleavage/methylation domain-containing protein [Azoarcus sp.]|jgi:MSHA pilin protein MshD|nr:prepilin-type N-terminal cleavage/methylation domain-containing protein [Azoarcus sp.]
MCSRPPRQSGFTLPELIMTIVIISVGLAGVLSAFRAVVKGSADPLVHKQMLAIAEEMMEELSLKPWVSPSGHTGGAVGCPDRAGLDNLDYYDGYECAGIRPVDGGAVIPLLVGYKIKVAVSKPVSDWNGIPASEVRRLEVRVTNGGESIQLLTWRANWAK